ncbi:MAG: nucleotide exchange factor GrpE [Bacilli bacterium]|nr:nucleotide exchange factor GrpE [Bacilli bacterium]
MEEKKCHCNEECTCGDECNCTEDVKCTENCHCGEHECHCDHDDKHDKKKEKHKYKKIIEELKDELKKKDQEVLVARADLINYRKRKDEEVVRMLKFCNEDLIKQILPIMDNFERAIKLDDNNLDDEVSKFLQGFKMIYCNMQNVMNNFEVKQIDGANKPFDPVYHNAIMVEQKEGVEPGMVIEVLQKGYIYKDKVIRPAMVKVSE